MKYSEKFNMPIETAFVKQFIQKEYQERFIYELFSKKREKAISRLVHNANQAIKPCFSKYNATQINLLIENIDSQSQCYIILGDNLKGYYTNFSIAIDLFFNALNGMIFLTPFFALIKEEQELGTPAIYLCSDSEYTNKLFT